MTTLRLDRLEALTASDERTASLMRLRHDQCRYVQEGKFSCTEVAVAGSSYCPGHRAICVGTYEPRPTWLRLG